MSVEHDSIVNAWKEHAQANDDQNYRFLRSLKRRSSDKVDRLARTISLEAFEIIDCTRCANCCRTMRPIFTDEDVERIAHRLGMTKEDFIEAYLEWDAEDSRYRTRQTPCPLLGEDNKCTVYEVRPESCRGYPFMDKEDFASRSIVHSINATLCPAAFFIVEELKKRIR